MAGLAATALVVLVAPQAMSTTRPARRCATKVAGAGIYPLLNTSCGTAVRVALAALEGKGATPVQGSGTEVRFGRWGCTLNQGVLFCSVPAFAPARKITQALEGLDCGSQGCPLINRTPAPY